MKDNKLILNYSNFKQTITKLINDAYAQGLPFSLMESVLSDLYHQVLNGANIEIEEAYHSVADLATQQEEASKVETQDDTKELKEKDEHDMS